MPEEEEDEEGEEESNPAKNVLHNAFSKTMETFHWLQKSIRLTEFVWNTRNVSLSETRKFCFLVPRALDSSCMLCVYVCVCVELREWRSDWWIWMCGNAGIFRNTEAGYRSEWTCFQCDAVCIVAVPWGLSSLPSHNWYRVWYSWNSSTFALIMRLNARYFDRWN